MIQAVLQARYALRAAGSTPARGTINRSRILYISQTTVFVDDFCVPALWVLG